MSKSSIFRPGAWTCHLRVFAQTTGHSDGKSVHSTTPHLCSLLFTKKQAIALLWTQFSIRQGSHTEIVRAPWPWEVWFSSILFQTTTTRTHGIWYRCIQEGALPSHPNKQRYGLSIAPAMWPSNIGSSWSLRHLAACRFGRCQLNCRLSPSQHPTWLMVEL